MGIRWKRVPEGLISWNDSSYPLMTHGVFSCNWHTGYSYVQLIIGESDVHSNVVTPIRTTLHHPFLVTVVWVTTLLYYCYHTWVHQLLGYHMLPLYYNCLPTCCFWRSFFQCSCAEDLKWSSHERSWMVLDVSRVWIPYSQFQNPTRNWTGFGLPIIILQSYDIR